jgi:hypothetical protein
MWKNDCSYKQSNKNSQIFKEIIIQQHSLQSQVKSIYKLLLDKD